jgi:hypothetical protein
MISSLLLLTWSWSCYPIPASISNPWNLQPWHLVDNAIWHRAKCRCKSPLFKVRLPPNPHVGRVHVFMHSTPLMILLSLHVKGLTQRCYGWNNKVYILTITHLNNQCETNPTSSLPLLAHLGPNHNYEKATNWLRCYSHPLNGWCPR